jgi:hypothetical protein
MISTAATWEPIPKRPGSLRPPPNMLDYERG